jgi:pyruvate/2-oxoglutarate dehydrogenase complex dihydrolipoamide acyltransferase (E2) component
MKTESISHPVPSSRIATFDVYSVSVIRHHISALLEFDVTDGRKKLRELKRGGMKGSFTGWLIYEISRSIQKYPQAAGYLAGKKRLITFPDINISTMVEKEADGKKVPIALVIEKANEKSITEITAEIEQAKNHLLSENEMVLNRTSSPYESLYFRLPGPVRRALWRFLLRHPRIAYQKMGNVMVTSLSMVGRINGWFIHKTVHPISFGIGSVIRKPVVVNDEIKVREILNMTILMDHDVLDGAPMVRMVNDLARRIENGEGL